jgi:ribosomal protein S4
MSLEPFSFVADRGDAGRRLDQVLVRRVTDVARLSRTTAQRWIEDGAVEVEARVVTRPSATVLEGAAIRVTVPPDAPRRVRRGASAGSVTRMAAPSSTVVEGRVTTRASTSTAPSSIHRCAVVRDSLETSVTRRTSTWSSRRPASPRSATKTKSSRVKAQCSRKPLLSA